jgi:hypothetical protein
MTGARRGFALPLALAGAIVLAGLAALASITANAAIRESSALRDEAQAELSRAALRGRVARKLARTPRGALLSQPVPLGGGDTALVVTSIAWPWHRLAVLVDGATVVAEIARATVPGVPWCASAVVSGESVVAVNALSMAASSECSSLSVVATTSAIAAFDSLVAGSVAGGSATDTLRVASASVAPEVRRASRLVEIAAGTTVSGLVIAPVVRIAFGAEVRGLVVAAESLVVAAGASIIADEHAVRQALTDGALLRPMGRRGLLLPP